MRFLPLVLAAAAVGLLFSFAFAAERTPSTPSTASAMPSGATNLSAQDSRIAIMGRFAFGAGGGARMGFPGVTVRFVYRGPAPTLRLSAGSATCFFNLACNGWDPVMIHLQPGENAIPLPAGEAPASGWLVELVRRNESWQGVATFDGLVLPPGCELLPPPAWPAHKLLFIGDSITCGEYIDLVPPVDAVSLTPRMANASRAFGMLLGRWLNAQVHLVSYGGRGVVRDWQGKTDTGNAPQFFQRALPDDPAARWDHSRYTPDAIVVCLGQNDFSSSVPDEREYTAAYDRFIGDIRKVHPEAALVLAGSPMQDETDGSPDRAKRDQLYRTLAAVAARRRATGDLKIAVATLHHRPGTTANAHPTAFQHEQIALDILPVLRSLTGW